MAQKENRRAIETLSLREYPSGCEQNVDKKMNGKGNSDEVLDANEENVVENWRNIEHCYKMENGLAEFGLSQNFVEGRICER